MIDRASETPLYLQVKQWIMSQIQNGIWKEGDMVQPERELAAHFGVNRLTVRQALSELAMEGWVGRTRGKGTFVSTPKIQQPLKTLTSFSEDMKAHGMKPSSIVLKMEIRRATELEIERLALGDETMVIELRRLRLADQTPIGVETAVLPYGTCHNLTEISFDSLGSLYSALTDTCGVLLGRAEQTIEAELASSEVAILLQIRPGLPVLKLERITYTTAGDRIEWVRSFYRGDRYKYRIELPSVR